MLLKQKQKTKKKKKKFQKKNYNSIFYKPTSSIYLFFR